MRAPNTATGIITIDLGVLADNWRALASLVAPAECSAVVKADAYGLGAERVIPALTKAGCRTFFVATAEEAQQARALAPRSRIFVLDGLLPGSSDALIDARALPVLSSPADIAEWAAAAKEKSQTLGCALQVDSGLNRLGFSAREVDELSRQAETFKHLDIQLIMSHLACADDPDDPMNSAQRAAFDQLRARLPNGPASLAASDGLMLGPAFHYDLVRPGYALYGGQAFKGGGTPVQPVVRVQTRILQVRDVAPGERVGYSATWRAERPSRVGVAGAGYADGFFRSASSPGAHPGGVARVGAVAVPIIGRVSMDLITIDVTAITPPPQRGDLIDLVGPGLSLEAAGLGAGTIGYEVLTSLSRRFYRLYVGEEV